MEMTGYGMKNSVKYLKKLRRMEEGDAETKAEAAAAPAVVKASMFYCDLCNIDCRSQKSFHEHLDGSPHACVLILAEKTGGAVGGV